MYLNHASFDNSILDIPYLSKAYASPPSRFSCSSKCRIWPN